MDTCTNLNKKMTTALHVLLLAVAAIVVCAVIARPQIYFVANALGIQMAPDWYQAIVDWVSAGGTIAEAFFVILGIALPGWVTAAIAGFGLTSA